MDDDQYSKDGAALLAFLAPIAVIAIGFGFLILWLVK